MRISDWSSDVCSSDLIEISIATGKIGGALHRQALSDELAKRGFRLTGDRNFGPSRERLEEMARLTLANIGDTLAGVHLPRLRSEEHKSELQSLMRISYAVFCLKTKKRHTTSRNT